MSGKRILIVGGVAGGATAAAHARRLSEASEIILLERGPFVSFANCGLPYYVGGEIPDKSDLLVQTPESLRARFNLDVRVLSEGLKVDASARKILVRDLKANREYWETYDDLILSTGAKPLKPPIPGIDRAGHFTVRGVPDVEAIDAWIKTRSTKNAVVIGGGFIGLEMVEQLRRRKLNVTVVEALPQILAPFDEEMAAWLQRELESKEVAVLLNNPVAQFDAPQEGAGASVVVLKDGARIPADLVILGLGVRPETALAQSAGLTLGERGGIRVDEFMRTADPHIWAVGDAIEVKDCVTGGWVMVPLAGPANRQGRIVAENVFGGSLKYTATCGTAILRVFDLTAACTGANERNLRRAGIACEAVHLHPASHASYYPGAHRIAMKILFDPESGRLLGAQAVGNEGVDKRIDVLATALKAGMTVHDLEELELAYAPPFGSAKDPVNLAGMVAQHVVHKDVRNVQWHEVAALDPERAVLLDVRDEDEHGEGAIPNSINVPLGKLRQRVAELPRDKMLVTYCQTGQRSYFACRALMQMGFDARNLSGAYLTWKTAVAKKNK